MRFLQTYDMDVEGSLTENELVKALDEVTDPLDRVEIKKIFNALSSNDTHVNIQTFKQNVMQYRNWNKLYQDKENCQNVRDFQNMINNANFENKMTFNPGCVSSPVRSKRECFDDFPRPSLHEETYESIGEDNNHLSEGEDAEASFSRPNHLRLSLRRSRKLSRKFSIISATESPSPSPEDELEHLRRQLFEKQGALVRCEAEMLREAELVKTLEDRAENMENANKELRYELENCKVNVRNLESHVMFLDEKLVTDQKEIEIQRQSVNHEKEKLLAEKKNHLAKEIELDEKLADFEEGKDELVFQNHFLQSIIQELREENKKLSDNLESTSKTSAEEVNKLVLQILAMKQIRTCQNNNIYAESGDELVNKTEDEKTSNIKKRNRLLIFQLLKRLMFRTGLVCLRETLIYLKFVLSE